MGLARQDGGLPSIHNDFLKARKACLAIEEQFGLRVTAPADRTAAPRPSRAEDEQAIRNGQSEPPRITLRRLVQEAAAAALSEEDFFARLSGSGALIRRRASERPGAPLAAHRQAAASACSQTGSTRRTPLTTD
jgi:4-diphosphocytidyl-2C-methyl-D-erythritol kinase